MNNETYLNKASLKLFNILIKKNLSVATAESCTGGLIAQTITNNPGSSNIFHTGLITYSNKSKMELLKIEKKTLDTYGAVSKEVVVNMVKNLIKITKADIGIAVSGIAGPTGGTTEKPVGTVYISVKCMDKIITKKFIFKLGREFHRIITKQTALYMLWKLLKEKI